LQLLLEFGTIKHKLLFLDFKIRVLFCNNNTEQLVSKTFIRNHEIKNCHLCRDFRQIVRITQLSCQIEFEILIVLNNSVTNLKGSSVTLLDNLLLKKWFNCRVKFLTNILN
jgi:hypothetical protein